MRSAPMFLFLFFYLFDGGIYCTSSSAAQVAVDGGREACR